MVLVVPVCFRSPLTSSVMARSCTSGISSGVTSHGPNGPNVSADLPLSHWPARFTWKRRSEMSFEMQKPAMCAIASFSST